MSENSFKGPPFDLHVLSTPPAFILSQDQTLNKMVSKQARRLIQITLLKLSLASKKLDVAPQALLMLVDNFFVRFWCFVFLLRCLIYKVHATQLKRLLQATAWTEYHSCKLLSTPFFRLFYFSLNLVLRCLFP